MGDYPRGGLIGKTISTAREIGSMQVPLHAAGACYFIVLAVFPALLLLLRLLRCTPMEVERLAEMLSGVLPEAFGEGAEEIILTTYDHSSGTLVGISAVTALWSASRGIYGLLRGLNAIYGVRETRGYLYVRILSMLYMFAFLLVLLLTFGLYLFGDGLLQLLRQYEGMGVWLLTECVDLRFWLLVALQTCFFMAMFTALPNRRSAFLQNLPGALMATGGWLLFSQLYSVYVEHFAHLSDVFGSVYAVALGMLWLYCCVSIVFYGGVLNRILDRNGTE